MIPRVTLDACVLAMMPGEHMGTCQAVGAGAASLRLLHIGMSVLVLVAGLSEWQSKSQIE